MGCGASKNNTDQTLKTTQKGPAPGYEKEAAPAGALAKSISNAIVNQISASASDIAAASGVQERRDSKGHLPQAQLDHAEVTATVTQQGTENRPEIITADINATAHVPTAHTTTKAATGAEAEKSGSKHSLHNLASTKSPTGAEAEKPGSKHSLHNLASTKSPTGAEAEKSGSKHSLHNLVHHEKTATDKEEHNKEVAKEREKENHQHNTSTIIAASPTSNREDYEKELAKEREKENHQPTSATDTTSPTTSPTTANPDAIDAEDDLEAEDLETDDDEAASDTGDAEVTVSGQIQVGVNKKPQKRRRKKRAPITNQVVTRSRASSLDADPHTKETKGHVKKSTQSLSQTEGKGGKNHLAGGKNQMAGSRETLGRKKEAAV